MNEIILQGIYELARTMEASQLIERFGQRIIDLNDFILMVRTFDKQISQQDIEQFYFQVLKEFRAQGITTYVMNELIRRASKMKNKKNYNSTSRTSYEIMSQIQKSIQKKNQEIERIFRIFDFDRDCMLKESEFKCFVEYYVPTITPTEYLDLRKDYPSQNVTLYELMQWLQDGTSMKNSMKMQRKPAQQQQYVPQFGKQQQQQEQQEEPQKQVRQAQPKQLEQPRHQKINPVLESILYEDPNQANILKSDIQFENYIILDYNLPGVQDFLNEFHRCYTTKRQFTDTQFQPSVQSLGHQLTQYQWKRLSEIWGAEHNIFVKDVTQSRFGLGKWISQKDIKQGELGDCYFLSTLSSMACRWPDYLLSLFLTQKSNQQGIYAIRLCIDGIWKAIVIDDYIPTKAGQPAFSQSTDKESWVILMEKCWAKAFGSYSNIISGESKEVIKSLTGGPTWTLTTTQPDFKDQFRGCILRKCLMTVGTFTEGKNYQALGLVPGHAYSILKQREIKGKDITLIKLRNPWGKSEWKGNWSDNSYLWTPELKEQFKVGKDDGIFYMELKDFMTYFNTIFVGYFQSNFIYNSQTLICRKNKSIYFQFNIDLEGEYYFTVHQQSSRHFKEKYQNYQYSPIRILLVHEKNDKIEQCKIDSNYDVSVGELLEKGNYIVQIKIGWLFWQEHEFTVSVYGEKSLKLRQIQSKQDLASRCFLKLARNNQNMKAIAIDCPQILTCQEFDINTGFGYIYYRNESSKTLDLVCNFVQMSGLKLKKPERGSSFKVLLSPGQEKLVLLTISPQGYQLSQQFKYCLK